MRQEIGINPKFGMDGGDPEKTQIVRKRKSKTETGMKKTMEEITEQEFFEDKPMTNEMLAEIPDIDKSEVLSASEKEDEVMAVDTASRLAKEAATEKRTAKRSEAHSEKVAKMKARRAEEAMEEQRVIDAAKKRVSEVEIEKDQGKIESVIREIHAEEKPVEPPKRKGLFGWIRQKILNR